MSDGAERTVSCLKCRKTASIPRNSVSALLLMFSVGLQTLRHFLSDLSLHLDYCNAVVSTSKWYFICYNSSAAAVVRRPQRSPAMFAIMLTFMFYFNQIFCSGQNVTLLLEVCCAVLVTPLPLNYTRGLTGDLTTVIQTLYYSVCYALFL